MLGERIGNKNDASLTPNWPYASCQRPWPQRKAVSSCNNCWLNPPPASHNFANTASTESWKLLHPVQTISTDSDNIREQWKHRTCISNCDQSNETSTLKAGSNIASKKGKMHYPLELAALGCLICRRVSDIGCKWMIHRYQANCNRDALCKRQSVRAYTPATLSTAVDRRPEKHLE